jgi:hypothetical protein
MLASNLIRWCGLAAIVGGVAWALASVLPLVSPPGDWTRRTSLLFIIAVLLMIVGLFGFHALQKESYGHFGRAGVWTVIVGSSALVLGLVVYLPSGNRVLLWLVYPVGYLIQLVGLVLYGTATLRARVLPPWCGLGFIFGPLVAFVWAVYGGIVFGVLWMVLGSMLWTRKNSR